MLFNLLCTCGRAIIALQFKVLCIFAMIYTNSMLKLYGFLHYLAGKKDEVKHPLILVLGLPFFFVVDTILLLLGQQRNSTILAFTETSGLPLSALDPTCRGVSCGEHYLCSVAANGHPLLVKPLRVGVRHGRPIICNRQLLVANAFEELLEENFPSVHRVIRRNYDRVGDFIHKDYTPYKNPWLCDLIYLLMKPADWCFLTVLYLCDRKPEERIARQYR
jgi:hypothetical protein